MVDSSTVWLPDRQGSDQRMQSQPIVGSTLGATQLSARRQTYQQSRRMLGECRKHSMGYERRGRRDASSHSLSPYNLNYHKAKQTNTRRSQQNVCGLLIGQQSCEAIPIPCNLFAGMFGVEPTIERLPRLSPHMVGSAFSDHYLGGRVARP